MTIYYTDLQNALSHPHALYLIKKKCSLWRARITLGNSKAYLFRTCGTHFILDGKCAHFNALYYANALYVFLGFSLFHSRSSVSSWGQELCLFEFIELSIQSHGYLWTLFSWSWKSEMWLDFYFVFMTSMNRIAFLSYNLSLNWQSHDKDLCFEIES